MKKRLFIKTKSIIFVFALFFIFNASGQQSYQTTKPWTYWWWMGSAVNKTDVKEQLSEFAKAGLGGVHIVPIYGVKGYENQFKDFLSEEWLEAIEFTIAEAEKLNLGVDLTMGTGWPFGGKWITKEHAAKKLISREFEFEKTDFISLNLEEVKSNTGMLEVLAVYASNGKERINLKEQITNKNISQKVSKTDWKVTVYGISQTRQKVKRAAPGGEGLVLDYFDKKSVNTYLNHFDSVFTNTTHPVNPRAFYHDSYEVYGANWTKQFLSVFKELQGYDFTDHLYILEDRTDTNYPLIIHDVRETLSELLYSEFTQTWIDWCKENNKLSRNQAHGSPGNLLDLYALADVPETESFGCSEFNIPGLECDPDYEVENFGRPSPLMMKFASSPANLLNKPLVSSETATWLADHFKVSLKQVKPQIDELLTAGINHVFYHGITYSPKEEGFPGWLFYASTNFGLQSHFWDEFPLLNNYIENCQKPLQEATADNDILLYFPVNDIWTKHRAKKSDILFQFDVHHYKEWFSDASFGETAELLWNEGYTFDYVSDKQIAKLNVDSDKNLFISNASKYQTIVVPHIDYIPESTLENLNALAEQGVKIIFVDVQPAYYSGFPGKEVNDKLYEIENFIISDELVKDINGLGIPQEELKNKGLDFIRKKNEQGYLYFITNLGNNFNEGEIKLSTTYEYLSITDPLTKKSGYVKTDGNFRISLPPGKSLLVQTSLLQPNIDKIQDYQTTELMQLNCNWEVTFENAKKHQLKEVYEVKELGSWTGWGDKALKTFSGKASYKASFKIDELDKDVQQYTLHIEDVRETAKVIVNGVDCGTIWSFPNQLALPSGILKPENQIEIIVQNLSSNYMKKYDPENPRWKKFYEINFVNITYDKFSTEKWDYAPSGLIGKIYLTAEK